MKKAYNDNICIYKQQRLVEFILLVQHTTRSAKLLRPLFTFRIGRATSSLIVMQSSNATTRSRIKGARRQSRGSSRSGSTERKNRRGGRSRIRSRKQTRSVEAIDPAIEAMYRKIDKQLIKHEWFHGVMPRSDCEEILKDEGDYLVRRTTVAKAVKYCISVRHDGVTKHIPINYQDNKWSILNENRNTLEELIESYMKERKMIPPSNVILVTAVSRPEYFILHEDVILGKNLGRGAFGEVYEGKLKLREGKLIDVAVKRAHEGHLKKSQITAFVREAKIIRRLNHANIVRIFGVAVLEEPVMILLELAVNGSMKAYLKKNESVSVDQKLNFAKDACRGMCYLSGAKVIHRDLAARNCLLGESYEVKITDFGLSVVDKSELRLSKLQKVPIRWLSPETLTEGVFTTKTDVWSFGILTWEIFASCKSDPFPGIHNAEVIELITNKTPPIDPPDGSPEIVKVIMDQCFIKNPHERADFATIFHILAPSEPLPASVILSGLDTNAPSQEQQKSCIEPLPLQSVD
ncbi:unnamed protein product [Cylicocyclus nassatus]|uniref:Tyrosine-protein kinase n=1 Tax=Cylicocyclus nassatus TaxID=53992 RepID=A0AA36GK72_CYLNA|nr:unnamed protein product [Cylicocyclus nassatus]